MRGRCRKLPVLKVEHNDMYSSKNTKTIVMLMIRRGIGHVVRTTEYTDEYQRRLEVNLRIILRLDLKTCGVGV